MTTPGGVPNLPLGALTIDTLASKTQDMSGTAMKSRAVERFPTIFDNSTGLSAASDITPFGILTGIWAEVNSLIANADPADVQGPNDLPALVIDFIESLPVIGQFVGLIDAILGTYTGDDTALLAIQDIFAPIRAVVDVITTLAGGSTTGSVTSWLNPSSGGSGIFAPVINGIVGGTTNTMSSLFSNLLGTASTASTASTNASTALSNFTSLINGVVGGSGNPLSVLISSLLGTASTASAASTSASSAVSTVTSVAQNIYNNWFGGTGATGTPTEVATAVASIKTAVLNGYTVAILSSTNASWAVPSGITQMIGCVINGGGKGANGSTSTAATAAGGLGGSDGGYLSADLDMTGITPGSSTLNVTVGAAASTAGTNGGQSSIKFGATTLLAGAANANGIATSQGLVGTTSQPGSGGNGGTGRDATTSDSGVKGEDSGVATGGAGGVGAAAGAGTGNAGSSGGAGTSASVPLCGGAGGGGGAGKGTGNIIQTVTGGTGGNGGFPGGGSGGGGGATNSGGGTRNAGTSGTPGNGIVAILYK